MNERSPSQQMVVGVMLGALLGSVVGVSVAPFLPPLAPKALAPLAPLPPKTISELLISGSEEEEVVKVVQRTIGSVVAVQIRREIPLAPGVIFDDREPVAFRQQVGGGSGFFVSKDGLLVTNRHVVDDPRAEYAVLFQNGTRAQAKVLAVDPTLDLAIMKVEGVTDAPVLELGDSDALQVGQTVIAIGNALAEFQNSVTKGVVSGKNRRIVAGGVGGAEVIEEAIQTDAAINLGNSGGPLIDLKGRVIGVNTAVSSGQSLGFAIPVNAVKRAVESVQKTGKIVRPWLGVRYFMLDEETAQRERLSVDYGAYVSRGAAIRDVAVVPGSPADKAGIKENDVILEIQGERLTNERSLATMLGRYAPGDKISLKILRAGEEKTLEVTLDQRTSSSNP